jgi:putative serine protease PepD
MSFSNRALAAAAAVALLAAGTGLGAGLYAALAPSRTTTVVEHVSTSGTVEQASASIAPGISVPAVYARTHEGVVDLVVEARTGGSRDGSPGGRAEETQAEGAGFVIDTKGDVVTNDHVVAGATSISVKLWNGRVFAGHVVGTDSSTDLAVVRISAPAAFLQPLEFGDSDAVQVGDPVIAIGSPFGLPQTVTSGIVSALHRTIDSPNDFTIAGSIQTDAPINHGNSGGPLLDAAGHVIGVNAQIQSQAGGSEGVAFAIPSNTVRSVVDQLVSGKTVEHAYLGVQIEDSTSPLGARLDQVAQGTPAARAKLQAGDVITKLDGITIASDSDLSAVINGKLPGDKLSITYLRHGKTGHTSATLTLRPS